MTTDTALALLAEARKFMDHYWACNRSRFGFHEKCGCGRDELLNRITALLDSGGWMPIETAPDDTREVEVTDGVNRCYGNCVKGHLWNYNDRDMHIATHWRDLPPLPKGDIK